MDNRSNADSGKETLIRVSPNGGCSLCWLFREGKEIVAVVRRNGLLRGPGRIAVFGFLDEVGVFQRASRREGEWGGLSTFEVRRKAVMKSRREVQGMR